MEVLVVLLPYSCSFASNNSKNSPNALEEGTLAGGFAGALATGTSSELGTVTMVASAVAGAGRLNSGVELG